MYCPRLFVVVLQELHCLQNIQYADAHLHMKINILTKFRTYSKYELMSYACVTEQQRRQRRQQRQQRQQVLCKCFFSISTSFLFS